MTDGEKTNIALQDLRTPVEQYCQNISDKTNLGNNGFLVDANEILLRNDLIYEPAPSSVFNHGIQLNELGNNPKWKHVFSRYITKYVNFVIPRRQLKGDRNLFRAVSVYHTVYEDEYTCCPPRLAIIIISIIELIFFIIDECKEENSSKAASAPIAQIFIYDPSKRYEIWRFFTYMFVHIGVLHLTVNLVLQIFIAIPLEMVHGWWRVLLIYFAGVVAGSLGTSIADPSIKLAGASGGIYSLITAHIATIILNWQEMSCAGVQLFILLLITGTDIVTSIHKRYYENVQEHIAYVAHFGGAAAGLLVGISVLRNINVTWKENIIWWIAAIVYVVLMLFGICWNIFYGDYFPHGV